MRPGRVFALLLLAGSMVGPADLGFGQLVPVVIDDRTPRDIPEPARPEGAEPAAPDPSPSPLHAAVRAGDRSQVAALLDAGGDLEEHDRSGRTPLYVATREGQLEVVELLVLRGARVESSNPIGLTPLHVAAARGHTAAAQLLISNCADVDATDSARRTPLHMAAAGGFVEIADLLIRNGADPQARQRQGTTPLRAAASRHHDELVERLRVDAVERLELRRAVEAAAQAAKASGNVTPVEVALPEVGAAPAIPRRPEEQLRFAQQKLTELGYEPGPADGRMGERTRDSISAFQSSIGQPATGEVSRCLLDRLARQASLRPPTLR